jgi:hypothetical protein
MSHEGGPEQPQRTVAELLAKYGAESGNQPRRRRRRADDMTDTGAQQIIDRVLSESGEMQAIRDDMPPPERTSHRRGADRGGGGGDYGRQPSQRLPQPGQQSSSRMPRPMPPPAAPPVSPSRELPRPQPPAPGPGQQSSTRMQRPMPQQAEPTAPVRGTPRPQPSRELPRPQPSQRLQPPAPPRAAQPPPGGTRDRSQIRSRLEADTPPPPPAPSLNGANETTEELPRVPGRIPVDGSMSGRRPVPPVDTPTQYAPAYDPYVEQEEDDYRTAYPAADPDERYEPDARYDTGERYDTGYDTGERRYDTGERGYDSAEYDDLLDEDVRRKLDEGDLDELEELEDDDLDDDREPSAGREWAIMIGQLVLGVIGGAAVWLGFNWLWGFLPAAALAVAVVVIVGLVLIVRKIRRAEDLQTTVLAILVGLVVTMSPAALLLLNR